MKITHNKGKTEIFILIKYSLEAKEKNTSKLLKVLSLTCMKFKLVVRLEIKSVQLTSF